MRNVLVVALMMSCAIAFIAVRQDKINKGYKPNAKDGDGDGLVQDGTKWERKA